MTTIVLVRHATTPATGHRLGGWTPGVHLDEGGVAQAQAVADRLASLPIAAVYASPLERTQETAKHVAKVHGLRVRTRRAIGEVDYGDWTDRPLKELRREKLWKVIQATPSRVTFPGGGSIRGAQQRAVDALESLAAEHGDDTIVVVSHADVIKAVLAHLLGMPLDTFQRLHIAPASVSVVHLADGAPPVVSRINDSGPLSASRGTAGRRPTRRADRTTGGATS
ncbi:MAG: MSMEG_4193 family putative phosphomutase [Nitriliruptor sp.]|uniref:MSMEG_4193 family putative phosphomutase n=1 Tax=Nitriliruptor sp. TaxID=2448056 RepID=UPI0034A05A5E